MNLIDTKFVFAATLVLSMLIPPSAGFGISGAIFDEEVSPGQRIVHEINVSSQADESPLNMTAEIYGFARTLDGTNIELSPEKDVGPFTARPFLSIEPKRFHLEPGERKTLNLTGTVPEDVGSGGRYAIVAIKTAPEALSDSNRNSISISTAIEAIVLLTIKDSELLQTGNITNLEASKGNESVTVDITFENTGNIHYKPFIEAVLKNDKGVVLVQREIDLEKTGTLLPANSRLYRIELVPETSLDPGTYTIEAKAFKNDGAVLDSKETTIKV